MKGGEKMKRISDEDVIKLCESKGLEYVGRFIKNEQTYLTCICNNHRESYQFEISYRNLKNLKHSCPKCAGKNMNTDDIKYRVEVLLKVPVTIIGEYVNMKTPIRVECNKCKKIWDANVVSLCQGSGCAECNKTGKPLKKHEVYVNELSRVQPNLIITSRYIGDSKPISYECKVDGFKGEILAGKLLNRNTQCSCCARRNMRESQMLSQIEFENRVYKLNPQIQIVSKYNGYNNYVTIKCTTHNQTYQQRACDTLQGKCGCTQCTSSKGEKRIEQILKDLNIEFESQYKFADCCDTKPLPFDFFISSRNIAIEYQGEQHYKPVQFGGVSVDNAIKAFENQSRHDNIKFNYCKDNGIKLLSIPYTEFDNLEKIIKENV